MRELAVFAAIQTGIIAVISALQLGLIVTVFALMDATSYFSISIDLFLDNYLFPLYLALFIISIFWNLAFKLLP